jgi:hypothetical protein
MLRWLIVFSLLIKSTGNSESNYYSSIVTDGQILSFLNEEIASHNALKLEVRVKKVNINIVEWDSSEVDLLVPDTSLKGTPFFKKSILDSLFNDNDRQFIKSQIYSYDKKKQWRNKDLADVKLITPKWIFDVKGRRDAYWEYSLPVFSSDYKWCIVKCNYLCGSLCADWITLLFQKSENGKWKKYKELWHVVS